MKAVWPKDFTCWQKGHTAYLSVPFTWLLPKAAAIVRQRDLFADRWIIGGPALALMPHYYAEHLLSQPNVDIGDDLPGVLQRVNALATRTSVGCIRRCAFCGVKRIEGDFRELEDWPDLPILCDNNLPAASEGHFARVIRRVSRHGWCDNSDREPWVDAVDRLRSAGIRKKNIRSYVLCGFDGGPEEDRGLCEFVESFGVKLLPMWYHELDALECNVVTYRQRAMGWTPRKRRELFCWCYQHRALEV